jgi:hypothetical protein
MTATRAPYMRRLIALSAVAVVLVIAATIAVFATRAPSPEAFKPQPYFPKLESEAGQIRHILIEDKSGSAALAFEPKTGWVATDNDGYPARYDKIQKLIQSLVDLTRYEKKTDLAEWQKRLLLTDPRKKGEATLVALSDKAGKPLAQILLGSNADVDAADGKQLIFVRAPGDNQVWLVRGEGLSSLSSDSQNWLDRTIIDLPKVRIASVHVEPAKAPAYTAVRKTPDADNFTVKDLPAGRQLKVETSANGIGTALSDLGFRDVARAKRIDFSKAKPTSITYETWDGLKVHLDTIKLGNDTWARVAVTTTDKAKPAIVKEAADYQKKLSPWVYELESWKGQQLDTTLASITESKSAAADKAKK